MSLPLLDTTITGAPALLIILVVLALLIVGAFVILRGAGRGAKAAARKLDDH